MMRRLILALLVCLAAAPAYAVRIKDISVLRSAHDSQLVGYGLVVGLQGSGDTLRNAPFTEQSVQAMLEHLGLDVHGASLRNRNVASVIVTTDLPAGMEAGSRLDVTVSALGDAPSLMGGTLLLDPASGCGRNDLRQRPGRALGERVRRPRPGRDAVARGADRRAAFRTARSSNTRSPDSPRRCARCSN